MMRHPAASTVLALVAVVLAIVALVVAVIHKPTVAGEQIKNESIQLADLNRSVKAELKGARGPAGPLGPAGPPGPEPQDTASAEDLQRLWDTALYLCGTLRLDQRSQGDSALAERNRAIMAFNRAERQKGRDYEKKHPDALPPFVPVLPLATPGLCQSSE